MMTTNAPMTPLILLSLLAIGQTDARLSARLEGSREGGLIRITSNPPKPAPACEATCPDGVGDAGEACCEAPSQCGNSTCDADETGTNCPQECPSRPFCGDGTCNADETCTSCPLDCTCTSSNCPPEATNCLCPDRDTPCSNDQDCPVTTSTTPGMCSGGLRSGLPCTQDVFCPTEKGHAHCVGVETVVPLPEEGSCRACGGVQQHSGLIIGDINQCGEGDLCGDFTNNVDPVTCVSCLSPMTCEDWCKIDNNFGRYEGTGTLESYSAKTNCPGGGFDSCSCTIASFLSDSWNIASNNHAGSICDAHNFGECGDGKDWCAHEFPDNTYCESLGPVSISGTLNTDGVCTCHATVGATTKDVWSSECIENLYMYDHGPHGNGNGTQPAVALPCSFTG